MISIAKSNYPTFANIHAAAIVEYCSKKGRKKFSIKNLDFYTNKYFGSIVPDFTSLLSATPEELFRLKTLFDKKSTTVKKNIKAKLGVLTLYNTFLKKNDALSLKGKIYNSDYLAQNIDVKTCPYCNENTTYSFFYDSKKQYRRTFDWDHIIPKTKYPFLAICYFNLVPACKVCNLLKLDKIIRISPHSAFNPDNTYKFKIKGRHLDFLNNNKSLELLLKVRTNPGGKALTDLIKNIALDARLNTQKDLIRDILNKKIIYKSAYWNSLENMVSKIGATKINTKDLFFSVYFNSDDYYKRPFSKLTKDIIE